MQTQDKDYGDRTHRAYILAQRAKSLLDAKQYEKAKTIYLDACKLDPNDNSSSMHNDFGLALQNLGDIDGAIAQFKSAIDMKQNPEIPTFNLAACYFNTGKLAEAKDCLAQFIKGFPDSSKVSEAKRLLADLNNEPSDADPLTETKSITETKPTATIPDILADTSSDKPVAPPKPTTLPGDPLLVSTSDDDQSSQNDSKSLPSKEASDTNNNIVEASEAPPAFPESEKGSHADYLNNIIANGVCRWPKESMPLKVYIADGANVKRYKPQYRDYMIRSFDEWCRASEAKLSWKLVEHEKDANIVCTWVSNKEGFKLHKFSEQGETHLDAPPQANKERRIHSATIQICTVNLFGVMKLKDNDVISVCRHEAGHSLGLNGHSPHPGDVMYSTKFSATIFVPVPVTICPEMKLTARDKATISRLYASYPRRMASAN